MPITKQAEKKLRRDVKVTKTNANSRRKLRETVKAYRLKPTEKSFVAAQKQLDKAAKGKKIHKNKAARLKSRLSKLINKKK